MNSDHTQSACIESACCCVAGANFNLSAKEDKFEKREGFRPITNR
jgi:hypothetical protein